MVHICCKANSDVCHTYYCSDFRCGSCSAASSQPRRCINLARDVTATCSHAHLVTRSILLTKVFVKEHIRTGGSSKSV